MIAGDSHGPTLVSSLQIDQKTSRIINVPFGVEHRPEVGKFLSMVVMIYLHAAQVNQFATPFARVVERFHRLRKGPGKDGFAFDVERIGLQ